MPQARMPPAHHVERRAIDVDAHTVRYRAVDDLSPEGRAAVLVHGQLLASDYMVPTLRALAPHMPAYAPDLPGYGKSSKPSVVLDVDALGHVLARWIAEMDLERPILIANSFGCAVATAAAVELPDGISGLVLQGPTLDPGGRGPIRSIVRGVRDLRREEPPGGYLRALRAAGLRRALATWRLMYTDRIEARLSRVTVPTLVVRGAQDPFASDGWARRLTAGLPEARFVTVAGAHTLVYNRPQRLAELIVGWVGGLEDGRTAPQRSP